MKGGMKRSGEAVSLQISGGLKAQSGYPDRRPLEPEKAELEPLNCFFQRQRRIGSISPESLERRAPENQGRMDPEKIGLQIDDSVEGLLEASECVPRKADHQLMADLKPSLFQKSSGHAGVLGSMSSMRSEKNLIVHRLDSDLHGLHPPGL
jgi:hypothetical protein